MADCTKGITQHLRALYCAGRAGGALGKLAPMNSTLMKYQALSALQHQQLLQIELLDEQRTTFGDIHGALHPLTAHPASDIQGFVLLVDDVPRGFFLLKRRSLLPLWAKDQTATLHGLLIDRRFQGARLGSTCVQNLPELALELWPEIERLMLAVHPANEAALRLYQGAGWVFNSEEPKLAEDSERLMTRNLR